MADKIMYSVEDAAIASGIGKTLLYSFLSKGELPARKIGRRTLILKSDLEEFLSNLESYPSDKKGGK